MYQRRKYKLENGNLQTMQNTNEYCPEPALNTGPLYISSNVWKTDILRKYLSFSVSDVR
jgi:hypothetical protein